MARNQQSQKSKMENYMIPKILRYPIIHLTARKRQSKKNGKLYDSTN